MNETVFIVGCSNESMNTAIVMANLDKNVTVLCHAGEIENVLNHYKFERQMVSLWDLYVKETKIQVLTGISTHCQRLFSEQQYQNSVIWLFLDALKYDEAYEIPSYIKSPQHTVVISGITPIGQADKIAKNLATSVVFYLPLVFIKDGESFSSMLKPDMVLLGEKTPNSHLQSQILNFFLKNSKKHFISDIKTVEFTRSTMMAMLATRLSFINEMARLADVQQVDIVAVQQALWLNKHIGKDYLSAGWGYGGSTLPKEMELLKKRFVKANIRSDLLNTVTTINEDQKELIFRKFWRYFDGFIEGKTVLIWGAGYRNGTGRTINSAIHPLLKLLWSYNIKTLVYVTNTAFEIQEMYGDNPLFEVAADAYAALPHAEALFIMNWSGNVQPNMEILNQTALPIFDAKNVLSSQNIRRYTGSYHGIGR